MAGYVGNQSFVNLTTVYLGIDKNSYNLDTSFETTLRSVPLSFIRSGIYDYTTSTLINRGSFGYYWSSRASSATGAYYLYFYSTNIGPQNNYYKGGGLSLRCVAR